MTKKLIADFGECDASTMTDILSVAARDIEDALIQCGATPGTDYSYKDLFGWAVAIMASSKSPDINAAA